VDSKRLALTAAHSADEIKVDDIVILDIGKLCDFADYFVLASCRTRIQMRAAAQKIAEAGKTLDRRLLGIEGEHSDSWILLDYGDVVIHLFHPETRRYYDLERLWGDARRVEWRERLAGAKGKA